MFNQYMLKIGCNTIENIANEVVEVGRDKQNYMIESVMMGEMEKHQIEYRKENFKNELGDKGIKKEKYWGEDKEGILYVVEIPQDAYGEKGYYEWKEMKTDFLNDENEKRIVEGIEGLVLKRRSDQSEEDEEIGEYKKRIKSREGGVKGIKWIEDGNSMENREEKQNREIVEVDQGRGRRILNRRKRVYRKENGMKQGMGKEEQWKVPIQEINSGHQMESGEKDSCDCPTIVTKER
ncbi:hypothetical protein DITRI_Ditri01bG0108400 [Diplodiscus trichospermus]